MNWTATITEADPFFNYDNSTENVHSVIFVKSAGLGLLVALTIGGNVLCENNNPNMKCVNIQACIYDVNFMIFFSCLQLLIQILQHFYPASSFTLKQKDYFIYGNHDFANIYLTKEQTFLASST
jgi:hypothetical protein